MQNKRFKALLAGSLCALASGAFAIDTTPVTSPTIDPTFVVPTPVPTVAATATPMPSPTPGHKHHP